MAATDFPEKSKNAASHREVSMDFAEVFPLCFFAVLMIAALLQSVHRRIKNASRRRQERHWIWAPPPQGRSTKHSSTLYSAWRPRASAARV
jgi:hypothetical protein